MHPKCAITQRNITGIVVNNQMEFLYGSKSNTWHVPPLQTLHFYNPHSQEQDQEFSYMVLA